MESSIDREDLLSTMRSLMRVHEKLDRVLTLLEDDGEEEEDDEAES